MHYFRKQVLATPVRLPSGRRINWEPCGLDEGVLATPNEQVAQELRGLIRRQAGGVTELTEAEYEELKKKPVVKQAPEWQPQLFEPPIPGDPSLPARSDAFGVPAAAANAVRQAAPASAPARATVVDAERRRPAAVAVGSLTGFEPGL